MHSKGIPPSCVHSNILLHAFTQAGLIDEAKRVNEELQPKGEVVVNVSSLFSSLLHLQMSWS